MPVSGGWLSSPYGWKAGRPYFHEGIDIAIDENTTIRAASSGRVRPLRSRADSMYPISTNTAHTKMQPHMSQVVASGWNGGYGKICLIDHGNGYETLYAHCREVNVKPGQYINRGEKIAASGNTGKSTGPHLHFEVRKDGKSLEPLEYLNVTLVSLHASLTIRAVGIHGYNWILSTS